MTASQGMFSEESKEKKGVAKLDNVKVQLVLDFDGTITGMAGGDAVSTPLYQSIQTDPGAEYDEATFIEEKEAISKLRDGFKKSEFEDPNFSDLKPSDMAMTKGSKEFLEYWADRGAQIDLISRNRREYIQTVMKVGEVDEKKSPDKDHIKDVNDLGKVRNGKEDLADAIVKKSSPDIILIADDSGSDKKAMERGAKKANGSAVIISFGAEPGQFNWKELTERLEGEIAKLQATKTATPGTPS